MPAKISAKIVERPVADLIPYARNARTHSDEQVVQIASSIREFGFVQPVLITSDNTIVAGHGRVLAAQKLGLVKVPVLIADGWTEGQRRAYTLVDNKLALNAGWDYEMLSVELADLKDMEIDLSLTGFSDGEISNLLNADWEPPEQEPLPQKASDSAGSSGHHIHLTADEAEQWNDALEPIRETAGDLSEGQAVLWAARRCLEPSAQ